MTTIITITDLNQVVTVHWKQGKEIRHQTFSGPEQVSYFRAILNLLFKKKETEKNP